MKKKTPFLNYHKRKSEYNNCTALCWTLRKELDFPEKYIFDFVSPDAHDLSVHMSEGYSGTFWGELADKSESNTYTSLRQSFVLLCAAINDEL